MGLIREPSPVLLLLAAFGRDPKTLEWARNTATDAWGPVALTSNVFDFVETDYYEPTMGKGLKKVFLVFERAVDAAELAAIKQQTNGWEEDCSRQYSGLNANMPAIPPDPSEPLPDRLSSNPPSDPIVARPSATLGAYPRTRLGVSSGRESRDNQAVLGRALESPVARPLNLDPGYLTEEKLVLASTKDHAHRIYLARGIYAEVTLHYQGGRWQSHDWTYPDFQRDDYHIFFTQCRDFLRRRAAESNSP